MLHYAPTLEGMEVVVVATVGERFLDEVIEGYSTARIFNSSIQLLFIGGSPQVYKPGMPVTTYVIIFMIFNCFGSIICFVLDRCIFS